MPRGIRDTRDTRRKKDPGKGLTGRGEQRYTMSERLSVHVGGAERMSPDDVLSVVHAHGMQLTRSGLGWYHRQGMIARPTVRALGRGRGKESIYPPDTAAEVIAAHRLLGPRDVEGLFGEFFSKVRVTPAHVARIREWAHSTTVGDVRRAAEAGLTPREAGWPPLLLVQEWLSHRLTVLAGEPRWVPIYQMIGEDGAGERDPDIRDDMLLTELPGVPK